MFRSLFHRFRRHRLSREQTAQRLADETGIAREHIADYLAQREFDAERELRQLLKAVQAYGRGARP